MQAINIRNPNERKKLIIAGALVLLAIILLWWAFFGFGGSKTNVPTSPRPVVRATPPPRPRGNTPPPAPTEDSLQQLQVINYEFSAPSVPDASRNIFAYYEPPPPPPVVVKPTPTPTPTPTPPVLLAGVNPGSVFARTADFTLEVRGDKFSPQLKVVVDNNPLPTRFLGPQQMSATVPTTMIQNPGTRQVMLRSPDGALYSNPASFNVAAPPVPNYSYIGIIGSPRYIDTAILQDKTNKELLNAQRGDILGGRFRVISISEKELVFVDTNLKIQHKVALTASNDRTNPLQRPAPRVESDDDEP